MFHRFRDHRLIISDHGIKYETLLYTIYSDWKSIKQIKKFFWQKQLVLENPIIEKRKGWWLWFGTDYWFFHPPSTIPIGSSTWEKYDEIDSQLRNQVPHLFHLPTSK